MPTYLSHNYLTMLWIPEVFFHNRMTMTWQITAVKLRGIMWFTTFNFYEFPCVLKWEKNTVLFQSFFSSFTGALGPFGLSRFSRNRTRMLPATASAAAASTATSASATTVFCEQILDQQCTIDNDATATTGDNEWDDRRDGTDGDRDRRGFSDPEYVPELGARRATESVHAAFNDATSNSRTTASPDPLVDTHW